MIKITHIKNGVTNTTYCQEKVIVSQCKNLRDSGYEVISKHPATLFELQHLKNTTSKPESAYKNRVYVEKVYK
jgi:hypothetical protein